MSHPKTEWMTWRQNEAQQSFYKIHTMIHTMTKTDLIQATFKMESTCPQRHCQANTISQCNPNNEKGCQEALKLHVISSHSQLSILQPWRIFWQADKLSWNKDLFLYIVHVKFHIYGSNLRSHNGMEIIKNLLGTKKVYARQKKQKNNNNRSLQ